MSRSNCSTCSAGNGRTTRCVKISCSSGVGWRNERNFLFFMSGSVKKRGRVVPQNRSTHSMPESCRRPKTRPKHFTFVSHTEREKDQEKDCKAAGNLF